MMEFCKQNLQEFGNFFETVPVGIDLLGHAQHMDAPNFCHCGTQVEVLAKE